MELIRSKILVECLYARAAVQARFWLSGGAVIHSITLLYYLIAIHENKIISEHI